MCHFPGLLDASCRSIVDTHNGSVIDLARFVPSQEPSHEFFWNRFGQIARLGRPGEAERVHRHGLWIA